MGFFAFDFLLVAHVEAVAESPAMFEVLPAIKDDKSDKIAC
jgi:hypothetical protein